MWKVRYGMFLIIIMIINGMELRRIYDDEYFQDTIIDEAPRIFKKSEISIRDIYSRKICIWKICIPSFAYTNKNKPAIRSKMIGKDFRDYFLNQGFF